MIKSLCRKHCTSIPFVQMQDGGLARGDLEETSYPLYVRFHAQSKRPTWQEPVNFDHILYVCIMLHYRQVGSNQIEVDLVWEAETAVSPTTATFVQIIEAGNVLAQTDLPPGGGNWQPHWWQALGKLVQETRTLQLPKPFDPRNHIILIGVYDSTTLERYPVLTDDGSMGGDSWQLPTAE